MSSRDPRSGVWKTSSDAAPVAAADRERDEALDPGVPVRPPTGSRAERPRAAGSGAREGSGAAGSGGAGSETSRSEALVSEEAAILRALASLDRGSRDTLVAILSNEDAAVRGRAIRALYRSDPTRGLAELLIDCEVHPDVRALLLALLRELERT